MNKNDITEPNSFIDENILKEKLSKSVNEYNIEEVIEIIFALANHARREGLLYLEKFLPFINDINLFSLLSLVIDGIDPDIVKKSAENIKKASIEKREKYMEILKEGCLMIQSGENPALLSKYLSSIIGEKPQSWVIARENILYEDNTKNIDYKNLNNMLKDYLQVVNSDITNKFCLIIEKLDNRSLQTLIREFSIGHFALSLKGCNFNTCKIIIKNLSYSAIFYLIDDIRCMGFVEEKYIIEAQNKVLEKIEYLDKI